MSTLKFHDRLEGELRRDHAIAVVKARRSRQIAEAQLAMLVAMRSRPDRSGTGDDASPPDHQWNGNAPFIGAAVNGLAMRKLILRVGTTRSSRPSRHANEIKVWRIVDDAAADTAIAALRRTLAALAPYDPATEEAGAESTLF